MIQPLASCLVCHLYEWRWYQPLRIDISTSTFSSWCFATFTSVYRINLCVLTTFTCGDDINLCALIFQAQPFRVDTILIRSMGKLPDSNLLNLRYLTWYTTGYNKGYGALTRSTNHAVIFLRSYWAIYLSYYS